MRVVVPVGSSAMAGEGALQYPGRWAVEATVEAIQDSMDMQPFARVEDVAEDLDELWLEVDTLGDRLEELTDSVSFLLLVEDRGLPEWPAD